jgi:hypothetical protein
MRREVGDRPLNLNKGFDQRLSWSICCISSTTISSS